LFPARKRRPRKIAAASCAGLTPAWQDSAVATQMKASPCAGRDEMPLAVHRAVSVRSRAALRVERGERGVVRDMLLRLRRVDEGQDGG
jgi:hypothetical protein